MLPTKKPAKGQNTIESFFSRQPANKSSTAKASKVKAEPVSPKVSAGKKSNVQTKDASSKTKGHLSEPRTPDSRTQKSNSRNLVATPSSSCGSTSSGRDTPPTSDVIDVDIPSDDQMSVQTKRIGKRRLVTDSDDEMPLPSSSSMVSESPMDEHRGRSKKPRLSQPLSDDEDEVEPSSFHKRIASFKNIPKARSKSRSSDDDDFIERPVDSDSEMKSASSRASSRSRLSSSASDDDSDDDVPKKSKGKPRKPSAKKGTSTVGGNHGGSSFLTAAEQRRQAEKDDKKSSEDAFAFLQDVKDKDGKRPGETGYDPRTLLVPKSAWNSFTPFETQFWEIKQDHYDTILFFQKGKFFELYEDDARIGHQEFDLKLTQRVKMSMVGVPEMSFDFWAAKFLAKGYKVGKVAQSETALGAEMRVSAEKKKAGKAPAKSNDKIVQRTLHKVYTNGTLVDPQLLTDEEAGHCVSIREFYDSETSEGPSRFGVCVLDCSTSQFDLSAFDDDVCRTKLETLIRQLRPKELLFTKGQISVTTTRLLKSVLPPNCLWTSLREVEGFGYERTLQELRKIYTEGSNEDEEMNSDDKNLPDSIPESIRDMASSESAIESLGSMLWYLRQLNIDKDIMTMKNFNVYDPLKKGEGLVLDGQTLAHIEVLVNSEGTQEGTLLKLLGRCLTPFGKRLFRIWICTPLKDIASINARLDAVDDLECVGDKDSDFVQAFKEITHKLPDLERIVSRIHAKNCKVKDFMAALKSFRQLSDGLLRLMDKSELMTSKTVFGLLRGAPNLAPHIRNVEEMFKPPGDDERKDDILLPKKGRNEEYDSIMKTIKNLENELDEELQTIGEETDLNVKWWHSGTSQKDIYMVETSVTSKNVPQNWTKHGGTKAKNRWIVPQLKDRIRKLQESRETRNSAIKAFKYHVYQEFDKDKSTWLRAVRVLAELDCLYSLAVASSVLPDPKCRPEFVESETGLIDFEDLTHPTLAMTTSNFIANTVQLGGEQGKIALLTGPNMAGKSTLMRMTAAGVIMAQLGMKVPAKRARLCPVDSILTRMGAYDNMFTNSSTFKVELDECCKILRDATPKSLVILDELGRGTSTFDGMAIASAVLHELATHTLSLSFFATHYGSLTSEYTYHPNIRNMHMKTGVNEDERTLLFLFKLVEGVATSSFGTYVGKVAGVPTQVVERAEVISKNFAQQFNERQQAKKERNDASARIPAHAQADFVYVCKLARGEVELPKDEIRRKEVLVRMKVAMRALLVNNK